MGLEHSIPGRIRVRLPRVKGDPDEAKRLAKRIAAIHGVIEVEASPVTGNMIVTFDPTDFDDQDPEQVVESLGLGAIHDRHAGRNGSSAAAPLKMARSAARNLTRGIRRMAEPAPNGLKGNRPQDALPLALILVAAADLVRSRTITLPPWYTCLWLAYSIHRILSDDRGDRRHIDEEMAV